MAPRSPTGRRRRRILGFLGREDGSAVTEFAILAPLLVLFSMGMIDVGRMAWTVSGLSHSAREAARFASLRGGADIDTATDAVEGFARANYIGLGDGEMAVSVDWSPDNQSGATVTVTLTTPFVFWSASMFALDPFSLSGASSMVVL